MNVFIYYVFLWLYVGVSVCGGGISGVYVWCVVSMPTLVYMC